MEMTLIYPSKKEVMAFFKSRAGFVKVYRIAELLVSTNHHNVQPEEIEHTRIFLHQLKSEGFLLVENEGQDLLHEGFSSTPDRVERYFGQFEMKDNNDLTKPTESFMPSDRGESAIPKLTLDTNCVINLFDFNAKTPTSVDAFSEIIRSGLSGKANVAITTRVEADLLGDRNAERKEHMLRMLQNLPIVGTVGRWDVSKWDSGDVWGGGDSSRVENEIQAILFPGLTSGDRRYKNKQMDIDHLVGHFINRRDIFITDDSGIWKKRDAFQTSPGITVMTPEQCVAHLEKIASCSSAV